MTSRTLSASSSRKHAPPVRALAFALLLLITYGVTAGATHRHGDRFSRRSIETAASLSGAERSGSTTGDAGAGGECLMCRLHQHLFAGLLHLVPGFIAPHAMLTRETLKAVSYFSQAEAPRCGRAPPAISIL